MYHLILTGIITLITIETIASGTNNLEVVYSQIAMPNPKEPSQDVLLGMFSLDHPDISQYMITKMNILRHRGMTEIPATSVLLVLLTNQPGTTCQWLLDNCTKMSPVGRANIVESLRRMARLKPCKEAFELLASFLSDNETVTDIHALALSPMRYHVHLRVCDYAYNALAFILSGSKDIPVDMPRQLFYDSPINDRDKIIAKLRFWWEKQSRKILDGKPEVSSNRSTWSNKLRTQFDGVKP